MSKNKYPVGPGVYFEGIKPLIELFGILYVDIVTPLDLKVPVLLHKVNGVNIAPVGSWSGWYFSEELKFAESLGYKITVQKGHLYSQGDIFSKYVDTLYSLRQQYAKSDSRNLIAKMLLNGLSGRFGLDLNMENHKVVKLSDIDENLLVKEGLDVTDFQNGYGVLTQAESKNTNLLETFKPALTSVPVAMAIAAYGRMHINKYKIMFADYLVYSDTDSLFLTCPLPDYLVSPTGLGLFKLEHVAKEGVFLGPKFYGLLLHNDVEVIKIRGFKLKFGPDRVLPFETMRGLLKEGNFIQLHQEIWHRNIEEGFITIKDTVYTAMVSDSKRQLIFNGGILTDTAPYVINQPSSVQ
jgi:hypothetical protein